MRSPAVASRGLLRPTTHRHLLPAVAIRAMASDAPKFDAEVAKAYAHLSQQHKHERGPWNMMVLVASYSPARTYFISGLPGRTQARTHLLGTFRERSWERSVKNHGTCGVHAGNLLGKNQ